MSTNQYFAVVVALVVLGSLVAGTASVSAATGDKLQIEVLTTEADVEVGDAIVKGQPFRVKLEYSDLGSGSHTIQIRERDTLRSDTMVSVRVRGDSGTKMVYVPGETAANSKEALETFAEVVAVLNQDVKSERVFLRWVDQTTYLKGVPETAEAGEPVTVTYYGWSNSADAPVFLYEDDLPKNDQLVGVLEDEQIRSATTEVSNGYYEEEFTFTASEYVAEEVDDVIEVQVRPETGPKTGPVNVWTDIVREIQIIQPAPQPDPVDAEIRSFDPPTGTYTQNELVAGDVVVENTGSQTHTFFVGFSVNDPNNQFHSGGEYDPVVTLDPGEIRTIQVDWTSSANDPVGDYGVVVAVWKESNESALQTRLASREVTDVFELQQQTPTPTPTPTPPSSDVTANRDLGSRTLSSGESTEVTIDVAFEQTEQFQIVETVDGDLSIEVVDGPGNVVGNQITYNFVEALGTATDQATVRYRVTVPDDATEGATYTFDGVVDTGAETTIDGDDTLTVSAEPTPRDYTNEEGRIDDAGLNDAVRTYLQGRLSDASLNEVVRLYLTGEPVT